jgi:hypothetical protein
MEKRTDMFRSLTNPETEGDGDREVIQAEVVQYDLSAITRAEIDIQIATAKRYPRDIQRFLNETETLACRTEEMAKACMYSLPNYGEDSGEPIVGPSIRLAEIALHCYGNARATVRIASEGDKFLVAQFSGMDLEKNLGVQLEIRRRITNRKGVRFNDDLIVKTSNAALSIAYRNGVWKLIPAALIEPIFQRVREVAMARDVPIEVKRTEWLNFWRKKGIAAADVFRVLGVSGQEGIEYSHLEQMVGWQTAIKEGGLTLQGLFSPALSAPDDMPGPATRTDKLVEGMKRARERAAPPRPAPLKPSMETKGAPPPADPGIPLQGYMKLPADEPEPSGIREPGEDG